VTYSRGLAPLSMFAICDPMQLYIAIYYKSSSFSQAIMVTDIVTVTWLFSSGNVRSGVFI
jgi:hypothetical protein